MRRTSGPPRGPSGRVQKPAEHSPVADSARPAFASSSATQPPSELPATCTRSSPSESRKRPTAAASACGVGPVPFASGGDAAEAGHVDGDHVALGGEPLEHGLPHDDVGAERMDQNQRLAPAAADVIERSHPFPSRHVPGFDGPQRTHSTRHRLEPRHRPRDRGRARHPQARPAALRRAQPRRLRAAARRRPAAPARCAPWRSTSRRASRSRVAAAALPPVDLLVNNAGLMTGGLLEEQDIDDIYAMFQVNLVAVVHLTKLVLPGDARARARQDRQQRQHQRLRLVPRGDHLRRGARPAWWRSASRCGASSRARASVSCTSSPPASTPTCSTRPGRSTAATWTPAAWDDQSPEEWAAKVGSRDRARRSRARARAAGSRSPSSPRAGPRRCSTPSRAASFTRDPR